MTARYCSPPTPTFVSFFGGAADPLSLLFRRDGRLDRLRFFAILGVIRGILGLAASLPWALCSAGSFPSYLHSFCHHPVLAQPSSSDWRSRFILLYSAGRAAPRFFPTSSHPVSTATSDRCFPANLLPRSVCSIPEWSVYRHIPVPSSARLASLPPSLRLLFQTQRGDFVLCNLSVSP